MLNASDYPGLHPTQDVKLAALGFDASGHRGGGISRLQVVTLPKGAVLLRLFRPPKPGGHAGDFGAWWFTPHEYRRICDRFGVDGRALIPGRAEGRSGLHGTLALLTEWYGGSPDQLFHINVVCLTEPLFACYGPGAPANSDGYTRSLKPVRMKDGDPARQVYIHQCWKYQSAMQRLVPPNAATDAVFRGIGPTHFLNSPRLGFET